MPVPRRYVLNLADPDGPGWVHCISRCVRKAFLAGTVRGVSFEHRKQWVEDRLELLARVCSVEVAAYAVMSNHLHVVVRPRPDLARRWSDQETAERWLRLFPGRGRLLPDGSALSPEPAQVERIARDPDLLGKARARLSDVSWFMKLLKEGISRRANREDECTGSFWESRFTSVPLLDQAALIACMAYVDLNPVRAKMCDRPERSRHTGARQRIVARQNGRIRERIRPRGGSAAQQGKDITSAKAAASSAPQSSHEREKEAGIWLAPMAACTPARDPASYDARQVAITAEQYLSLLDLTGRVMAVGKSGRIPPELPAILKRLDLKVESWLATMLGHRAMSVGAIGSDAARQAEAARRGVAWVRSPASSALFAA